MTVSPPPLPSPVQPAQHSKPVSPTFSGLLAQAAATIMKSRTGRVIAALFVGAEIYLISVGPVWLQAAELRKKWAELHVAQAEAAASREKLRAEADKAEAEAIAAEQTGKAAPELEAAVAREITEKGNLLLANGRHARDLAKAAADKMEGEAAKAEAEATIAERTGAAKIAKARSDYQLIYNVLGQHYLGRRVSDWKKMIVVAP